MDITVLPNNNHPEKFLQLDVGMLPATHGMFQIGAAWSRQRHWHNRMYSQRGENAKPGKPSAAESPVFQDRELEKHITPHTLKPKIKQNPLYSQITLPPAEESTSKPCWTIEDYDKHTSHGQLGDVMKEDPRDLSYWLEDLYTPGFDSLLKRKAAEMRRSRVCKVLALIAVSVCAAVIIITVPILLTKSRN